MKSTLVFFIGVLSFCMIIISCGKDNDGTPEPPPEKDSLGVGWQRIDIPNTTYFGDIFFINNTTGFVGGKKYLGKTTDGGLTWKQITLPAIGDEGSFIALFFLDQIKGWAITGETVFRTEDGGDTWLGTKTGFFQHHDIQFLNDKEGYLASTSNLSKTVDGGKTWTIVPSGGSDCGAVFFLNKNLGWVDRNGIIYNTTNGGTSFVSQNAGARGFHSAQFVDPMNGWFAGSQVYSTKNGGVTWTNTKDSAGHTADIHFLNANTGYLSFGNRIYKTSDGGTTLTPMAKVASDLEIIEIFFTDENHGWACSNKSILRYVK